MTSQIFAQITPSPGVQTELYKSPTNVGILGNLVCNNQSNLTDYISVALDPTLAVLTNAMWIAYNVPLQGHSVVPLQLLGLYNQSKIIVVSQNGTTNFVFTGSYSNI